MRASSLNNAVCRVATLTILLVGCSQAEVDRPGTWRPSGVNDQNLRAMLVNPQDLYVGSGANTARGDSAARAVTRLLTDRRRPLLDVQASTVTPSTASPGDTPVATGGTGGTQ